MGQDGQAIEGAHFAAQTSRGRNFTGSGVDGELGAVIGAEAVVDVAVYARVLVFGYHLGKVKGGKVKI